MNTTIKAGLCSVALAGGLLFLSTSTASAAETTGEESVLGGTQVELPVEVPVDVSDNAISLLGDSNVSTHSPAEPVSTPATQQPVVAADTTGQESVAGGTQVQAPVQAPVTVENNAISLTGDSEVDSTPAATVVPSPEPVQAPVTSGEDSIAGGSQVHVPVEAPVAVENNAISLLGDSTTTSSTPDQQPAPALDAPASTEEVTSGQEGILGGNQVTVPVDVPVMVEDNSISLLGDSSVTTEGSQPTPSEQPSSTVVSDGTTTGENSIAGGNQLSPVIEVPVNVSDNAISLLGDSDVSSSNGAVDQSSTSPVVAEQITTGQDAILGGNQIQLPVEVPVTVEGNAVSLLGHSNVEASQPTSDFVAGNGSTSPVNTGSTNGEDSIAGGNQVSPIIEIPVNLSNNSISLLGNSNVSSSTPVTLESPGGTSSSAGQSTTGEDGTLGGNQIGLPITIPVDLSGNSVSLLGNANTEQIRKEVSQQEQPVVDNSGVNTSGVDAVAGGNQIQAPITIPVDLSDNAISLLGDSAVESTGSDETPATNIGGVPEEVTSGDDSVAGGNQIQAPVSLPIAIEGNAISLTGDASTSNATSSETSSNVPGSVSSTDGADGLLGGNIITLPISVPLDLSDNAISIIGDSSSSTSESPVVEETPVPVTPVTPSIPENPSTPVPNEPTTPVVVPTDSDEGVTTTATPASNPGITTPIQSGAGDNESEGSSRNFTGSSEPVVSENGVLMAQPMVALADTGMSAAGLTGLAVALLIVGAIALGFRTRLNS